MTPRQIIKRQKRIIEMKRERKKERECFSFLSYILERERERENVSGLVLLSCHNIIVQSRRLLFLSSFAACLFLFLLLHGPPHSKILVFFDFSFERMLPFLVWEL